MAAHPFRWGQPFLEILAELKPELDGLELLTSNMDQFCREQASQVWRRTSWSGLGSSDAHESSVVGCCDTEFPTAIRDQRDLVEALRSDQGHAREPAAVIPRSR